jgi:hypothetical protein
VNHLVLSGTATVVPSGTRSSCYRGPESELTPWRSIPSSPRNFPNLESFGFLLTDCDYRWAVDGTLAAKPHAPAWRSLGQSYCQQAVVTGSESDLPQSPPTNSGGRRD